MRANHVLPLEVVFQEYQIHIENITWENIHLLGDKNINALINKIKEGIESKVQQFKNYNIPQDAHEKIKHEKVLYGAAIKGFLQKYRKNRNAILKKLTTMKSGINKPLIPRLRDYRTYKKHTHLVTSYMHKNYPPIGYEWMSVMVNYSKNEYIFTIPYITPSKYPLVYDGNYWRLEMDFATFMEYEEFIWFQNNKDDKEFIRLWYRNSRNYEAMSTLEKSFTENPSTKVVELNPSMIDEFKKKIKALIPNTCDQEAEYYEIFVTTH